MRIDNWRDGLTLVVLMAGLIWDDFWNMLFVICAGALAVALGYGLGKAVFG